MQTVLPVILALTFPGTSKAVGRTDSGFGGVMQDRNRYNVLTPLGTMFLTGLVNLVYFGPATTTIMRERKHQGNVACLLAASALMNEHRNKRRKESLRRSTAFEGDAASQQEVWYIPWSFYRYQSCRTTGDYVVRWHSNRNPVKVAFGPCSNVDPVLNSSSRIPVYFYFNYI